MNQFQKTGKVKYSKETNEVALKNWPKYNDSESPKVLACVSKELKLVKNKALIQYLYSMDTQPQETKEEAKAKKEEEAKPEPEETAIAEVCVWPTFLDFWDKYDKRVGKPKAEICFKKINQGAREKIMQHLDEYILVEKQYRKDPERYLKAEAWNNEVIIKQPIKNGNEFNPQTTLDRLNGYGE